MYAVSPLPSRYSPTQSAAFPGPFVRAIVKGDPTDAESGVNVMLASGDVIVHVNVFASTDAGTAPSRTLAVTVKTPGVVAVPVISPVDSCSARPAGSPLAV